jgi:ribosome biogenesis protein BRX1
MDAKDAYLSEEEEDEELGRSVQTSYVYRQRTLVLMSRGVGVRERHLVSDFADLLPHSKKDFKLDTKKTLGLINELADMKNCNNVIYFEMKGHRDLYMWMAKTPSGPSIKFQVLNVHTMDELKMTGNCLKGSRPILSFDSVFDSDPHWKLYKEMFVQIFGSPKGHPKTKPFIDHIFSFTVADGRIWFRNYQIVYDADPTASAKEAKNSDPVLVEIGPRMVLWPVKILSGSFSGESLYENPEYKTPPIVRKLSSSKPASDYTSQLVSKKKRKLAILNIEKPDTELDIIFNDD